MAHETTGYPKRCPAVEAASDTTAESLIRVAQGVVRLKGTTVCGLQK